MKKRIFTSVFIIIIISFCLFSSQGGIVLVDSIIKMNNDDSCKATRLLDQQRTSNKNSVFSSIIDNYYINSINICANDTGEDGISIMKEQYNSLCNSMDPRPKIHPSIGFFDEYQKVWILPLILDNKLFSKYPSNIWAVRPGEYYYALCVAKATQYIDKCNYIGGHIVQRYYYKFELILRSAITGGITAETFILGPDPEECAFIQKFPKDSISINLIGDKPDIKLIIAWIEKIISSNK